MLYHGLSNNSVFASENVDNRFAKKAWDRGSPFGFSVIAHKVPRTQ